MAAAARSLSIMQREMAAQIDTIICFARKVASVCVCVHMQSAGGINYICIAVIYDIGSEREQITNTHTHANALMNNRIVVRAIVYTSRVACITDATESGAIISFEK